MTDDVRPGAKPPSDGELAREHARVPAADGVTTLPSGTDPAERTRRTEPTEPAEPDGDAAPERPVPGRAP